MLKLCTSSAQSLLPMASCQIVRGRQHGRHRVEIERPEPATFSGTPSANGDYPLTVTLTDAVGRRVSFGWTLRVVDLLEINFATSGPPPASIERNVPFDYAFVAAGGTPPYHFSRYAGSGILPSGVALNATTGHAGTPTTVRPYNNIKIRLTDANGSQALLTPFNIAVISSSSIDLRAPAFPRGTTGLAYALVLTSRRHRRQHVLARFRLRSAAARGVSQRFDRDYFRRADGRRRVLRNCLQSGRQQRQHRNGCGGNDHGRCLCRPTVLLQIIVISRRLDRWPDDRRSPARRLAGAARGDPRHAARRGGQRDVHNQEPPVPLACSRASTAGSISGARTRQDSISRVWRVGKSRACRTVSPTRAARSPSRLNAGPTPGNSTCCRPRP